VEFFVNRQKLVDFLFALRRHFRLSDTEIDCLINHSPGELNL